MALAESTGGSIACPASFCGVYGFTPSYGVVSRYGLIDYGSSLDKIGTMGKHLEDVKLMYDVIKGHDHKDSTSLHFREDEASVKKVAIVEDAFDVDDEVKHVVFKKLHQMGVEYDKVALPLTRKYALAAYSVIAMTEASTNLAKYCGMRYGKAADLDKKYNEYFAEVRSQNLGKEAKRRIILGTFARMAGYRDAYYIKALQLRTMIVKEYKEAFKQYDVIVTPTMPILPPKIEDVKDIEPLDMYKMDQLTVGVNLAGLPHLSLNAGFVDGLPVGMMVVADQLKDNNVFALLEKKWK
jgi:aspartyl-tRNA(Asn)/glutamyl-tRNA(Gln) amidotransferase subunit A